MEWNFILMYAYAAVRACRDIGGFLPSVIIAMMCLETGFGHGNDCNILVRWFNLLGMKAELHKFYKSDYWDGNADTKNTPEYYSGTGWTRKDDEFCVYTSAYQCCMDFLSFMRDGIVSGGKYKYRDLMTCKDFRVICKALKDRKYATDPNYDKSLIGIINKYGLTKFDSGKVPEAPDFIDRIQFNASQVPEHNGNSHEYLAIHYRGKEGENPNLFNNGFGGHFDVSGKGQCYMVALVTDKIWHVGASSGFKYIHDKARNANTIGIEISTYEDGGKWYFTEEAQAAAAKLAAWIMFVLDIPADHLLRHGDITTKHCPAPYIDYEGQGTNWTWSKFKQEVKKNMSGTHAIIKRGSKGEEVRKLQAGLMKLGFCDCQDYLVPESFTDGSFGPRTEKYIKLFQQAFNLAVDGICGPLTWAALEKAVSECNADKINFTAADLLKAAGEIGKLYKDAGDYIWASAEIAPWYQRNKHVSSCDRFVDDAFNRAGLCLGNREAKGIAARLLELGGRKIEDVLEVKPGDVVLLNSWHIFISNGQNSRYDAGSTDRMRRDMPTTEGIVNFGFAVRMFEDAEPEPVPTEPETGKKTVYQVQAGLFSVKANAERKKAMLEAAGFAAIINEIQE